MSAKLEKGVFMDRMVNEVFLLHSEGLEQTASHQATMATEPRLSLISEGFSY